MSFEAKAASREAWDAKYAPQDDVKTKRQIPRDGLRRGISLHCEARRDDVKN